MSETGIIFSTGDRALYEGHSKTEGVCLSSGDIVTVVTANEDPEDDCIVQFLGAYIAVPAPFLRWLESGSI